VAHVGTRGSRLARAQTAWVIERLRAVAPDRRWLEVLISTAGDQSSSLALGTGVFVKEIEQALLEGAIDVAVHSLKDLPTDPTPGLTIAAVPVRADPRDCIVGGRLQELPDGARVGTGSPRGRRNSAASVPASTSSPSGATCRRGWTRSGRASWRP